MPAVNDNVLQYATPHPGDLSLITSKACRRFGIITDDKVAYVTYMHCWLNIYVVDILITSGFAASACLKIDF